MHTINLVTEIDKQFNHDITVKVVNTLIILLDIIYFIHNLFYLCSYEIVKLLVYTYTSIIQTSSVIIKLFIYF